MIVGTQGGALGDKGGQVAVPTHFFKVILAERRGGLAVGAFIMPNKPIPPDIALERFTVDLAAVERASVSTKQLHLIRAALDTCIAIQKRVRHAATCVNCPYFVRSSSVVSVVGGWMWQGPRHPREKASVMVERDVRSGHHSGNFPSPLDYVSGVGR